MIMSDGQDRIARERARYRWREMIRRCTDPRHKNYVDYGGRGISVCERWLDFDAYYADTGPKPDGMWLDRIDNDGDYDPSNTRWATPKEQHHNRRRNPQSAKTHCPHGHPYSGDNLRVRPGVGRACRTCDARRTRERYAKNRLARQGRAPQEGATA